MIKTSDISVDMSLDLLNKANKNTLMEQLGIEYTELSKGFVKGQMPVDHRTVQPVGILHGGASLAFAETLAGVGSFLLIDLKKYNSVGAQVSANHVGMAVKGIVTGEASIVHQGKTTHVWNVDIKNEEGGLISSVRVTNLILKK